ncbi:MAG: TIGR02996 domain-containing protein [Myxococcota bacterium]
MNDVQKGLLDGILAAPDDDLPRRVYADWLEADGQAARAEFVRLQLDHDALPRWDVGRVHSRLRQRELLAEHDEAWRAALPEAEGVRWGRWGRGFVERVAFDDPSILAARGVELQREALFSHVMMRWPRLKQRRDLPAIPGVTALTLVGATLSDTDLQWLGESELLSTVRELNLVESQLTAEALAMLLRSPHVRRLRALRLPGHNFANEGVAALVGADLPELVDLDLGVPSGDDLGSGGRYEETMDAEAGGWLAAWPGLARLHTLVLTGNQLGLEGLSALLSSPHVVNVKTLSLRGTADYDYETDGGRPDVLVAFSRAAPGLALDEVDLSECECTKVSTPILVGSSALSSLKILHYDYTNGGPWKALLAAPWAPGLHVLSANDCGDDGIKAIMAAQLPELHTLSMSSHYGWSQPSKFGKQLAKVEQRALVSLTMQDANPEDDDLKAIGKAKTLPALRSLDLRAEEWGDMEVSEEATEAFVASPVGAQLQSLMLGIEGVDRAPEPERDAFDVTEYRGTLHHL